MLSSYETINYNTEINHNANINPHGIPIYKSKNMVKINMDVETLRKAVYHFCQRTDNISIRPNEYYNYHGDFDLSSTIDVYHMDTITFKSLYTQKPEQTIYVSYYKNDETKTLADTNHNLIHNMNYAISKYIPNIIKSQSKHVYDYISNFMYHTFYKPGADVDVDDTKPSSVVLFNTLTDKNTLSQFITNFITYIQTYDNPTHTINCNTLCDTYTSKDANNHKKYLHRLKIAYKLVKKNE